MYCMYHLVQQQLAGVPRKTVQAYLAGRPEYQTTVRVQSPVTVPNQQALYSNHVWAIDLVDLGHDSKDRGMTKILACVVFSRYCVGLRSLRLKTAAATLRAFKSLTTAAGVTPVVVLSDNGMEFAGHMDVVPHGRH